MDLEQQFDLEHLLFKERVCRSCGRSKDLLNDYYLIRKGRSRLASSYSYECKLCTIERVIKTRKSKKKDRPRPLPPYLADYPDW